MDTAFNFIIVMFRIAYCHSSNDKYFWRVTIQQKSSEARLNIAEVHFFHNNVPLKQSNFKFSASSYTNPFVIVDAESGPPEAANDGNKNTFFHSGYLEASEGNKGDCCPDPQPALVIHALSNATFDCIQIINRQDLDSDNRDYFYRLIGATITVHDSRDKMVFKDKIDNGSPQYTILISSSISAARKAQRWIEQSFSPATTRTNMWNGDVFNYEESGLIK